MGASVAGVPTGVLTDPPAKTPMFRGAVINAGAGVYIADHVLVELVVGTDWTEAIVVANVLGDDGHHLSVGDLVDASFVVCKTRRHVSDYLALCGVWVRASTMDLLDQYLADYRHRAIMSCDTGNGIDTV